MTATPEPPDRQTVMDLYKLSVEMADRVSARRSGANTFFLALQTGLATVLALFAAPPRSGDADPVILVAAASAGVVLAAAWWLLLRSYRDLNRAKFAVINKIEADYLPIQPFNDEWISLKKDRIEGWRGRYAELGTIERVIPILFGALYVLLALRVYLK